MNTKQFGLDPIKDWATINIMQKLLNNGGNTDVVIGADIQEPIPIEQGIIPIKRLINSGHQLILSTTEFDGDDGGPLLMIYLLKPEHKINYESETSHLGSWLESQYANMKYIIQHSHHFITIWAGSY